MTCLDVYEGCQKIVTISPQDNSLVVDHSDFTHYDTIPSRGLKEVGKEFLHLVSYSSTVDENIFCWPCGNNDLGVVDLQALEYDVVVNFFLGDPLGYLPLSLKTSHNGRKVVALTFVKATHEYSLYFWTKVKGEDGGSVCKPVKAIDPHSKF